MASLGSLTPQQKRIMQDVARQDWRSYVKATVASDETMFPMSWQEKLNMAKDAAINELRG